MRALLTGYKIGQKLMTYMAGKHPQNADKRAV